MRRSRAVAAIANWVAFAATLAVALMLTPFLIAKLGTDRYDVWCLAEAVLAYFTLLDMGMAACLVRGVARRNAARDQDALNRMASACLGLFVVAGCMALAAGMPVMLGLAGRRGNPDVVVFLLLMLLNLAFTLPLSVFPSILDGLECFTEKSLIRLVFLACRTTAIVFTMHRAAALAPLAIVLLASTLLEHAAFAVMAFRRLPGLRFRLSLVTRDSLLEIWKFSLDAFLAMIAGRITGQTGLIFVGLLMVPGSVTIFATSARLVEYSRTLLRTVTATLTPGVSALEARGEHDSLRKLFLNATRAMLYLALPIQLGLWFFGTPFLVRWVPEVGTSGSSVLAVLAATLTVSIAQSVASRFLYGLGMLRTFARLTLFEALLNLVLLFGLTPHFGVAGVAYGMAIPNMLASLLIIRHATQLIGLTPREYWKHWSKPSAAAIVPLGIWLAIGTPAARWDAILQTILSGLLPFALTVMALEWHPQARSRPRRVLLSSHR